MACKMTVDQQKLVDVSALISGDVDFVQVDMWTPENGLRHVKLRVVEEVEVDHWSRHCLKDDCPEINVPYSAIYCPGCGNKIKR